MVHLPCGWEVPILADLKEKKLSAFTEKVIRTVRQIPRGRVATYRQIATLCGKPHASRGVSWILNSCAKKYELPWQRVVSSQGRISFKPHTSRFRLQAGLLRREGVKVDVNGEIEMAKVQWKKEAKPVKRARHLPRMFS